MLKRHIANVTMLPLMMMMTSTPTMGNGLTPPLTPNCGASARRGRGDCCRRRQNKSGTYNMTIKMGG
uniref:Putative secreted peptide n=1 Tax=Anopheles braziliensis TaxID=58242 RepID=A0A2M3ZTH7_9DIPT